MNQNSRSLEIEAKVNLILLVNKQKCDNILQNQEQEKYAQGYGFLSFTGKYKKQLLQTGLDASKKQSIKQVNLHEIKLQMQ